MALYDGFFDGTPVGTHEDGTVQYDREYNASDFYEYFGRFIGSGVCVHNNPDSMKIFLSGNQAVIMPGYLFINGEWLANKAGPDETNYQGYAVTVSATEKTAVLAHLSLGKAMIEIMTQPTSQAYPSDSLVLGIVDIANNTVEDTRYNSEICGVIDAASSLTTKIDFAINYIDTEIDAKLAAAEAQINAKSDELESKIAEVRGIVNSISPPPIGAIKISASTSPGTGWLQCDGSFISESVYPELVALLGKMSVENLDLTEIATGRIPADITNTALYNGYLWVFSYSAKKLYGISMSSPTAAVKTVPVTGIDTLSSPSTRTIYLSIANGSVFLTQKSGSEHIRIFMATSFATTAEMETYSTESLEVLVAPYAVRYTGYIIPYVTYENSYYRMAYCARNTNSVSGANRVMYLNFKDFTDVGYSEETVDHTIYNSGTPRMTGIHNLVSMLSFSTKNADECVITKTSRINASGSDSIVSVAKGVYSLSSLVSQEINNGEYFDSYAIPIVSADQVFFGLGILDEGVTVASFRKNTNSASVTVPINLPGTAKTFYDSAVYVSSQDLWLMFVGTGLIVAKEIDQSDTFGYVDTRPILGTIARAGNVQYDSASKMLYIVGQDDTGTVKVGKLNLADAFRYSDNGTWLPTLAYGNIPTYIKAKGDGR